MNEKFKISAGDVFGELTATGEYNSKSKYYGFICSCGEETWIPMRNIKNGQSKCYKHDRVRPGMKFNEWTILEILGDSKAKVRCSCGVEKTVQNVSGIKRGISKSCGHIAKQSHLVSIGERFGKLTVIELCKETIKGHAHCVLKCDCGTVITWPENELRRGHTKSCGCHLRGCRSGINPGDRFGRWTVIEWTKGRSGKGEWLCRCDCGKELIITSYRLKRTSSCGCGRRIDPGTRFGRLVVIEHLSKEQKYRCICDCGKEKLINGGNLVKENNPTRSCGCLARQLSSERSAKRLESGNVFHSGKYHWYVFDDGKRVPRISSFEVFVWNYYKHIKNKNIERNPKPLVIDEYTRYHPDFYLPDEGIYLEPKGTYFFSIDSRKQKKNIETLKSWGHNINVMFWKDIIEQCELPYRSTETYFMKAKKRGISPEDYLANMLYVEDGKNGRQKTIQG